MSPDVEILHYDGCTADYPEKPVGEAPQSRTLLDLGDGEGVLICDDCGATAIVPRETTEGE